MAHLFASSLMSRWLLKYTPAAALLRLCALSILLSYACTRLFHLASATAPNPYSFLSSQDQTNASDCDLSRALPVWIIIAVSTLVIYFSTQQDICVDEGVIHTRSNERSEAAKKCRDADKRRRQALRVTCLSAVSTASLVSLAAILAVIHLG